MSRKPKASQIRTVLYLQYVLTKKAPGYLIISTLIPIIMLVIAGGVGRSITSLDFNNIPTGFPLSVETTIKESNQAFGAVVPSSVSSDPLFGLVSETFKRIYPFQFQQRNGSEVPVLKFQSVSELIKYDIDVDKAGSGNTASLGYHFPSPLKNETNNGRIDLSFTLIVDRNRSYLGLPSLAATIGQAASTRFAPLGPANQPAFLITQPSYGSFQTEIRPDPRGALVSAFITSGLTTMISFMAVPKVIDREQGFLDLLIISGLTPFSYFIGSFIADIFKYYLSAVVSLAVVAIFKYPFFYQTNILAFILPIFAFGPNLVLSGYCLSFFFKSERSAGPLLGLGSSIVVFVPYFIIEFGLKGNVPFYVNLILGLVIPPLALYRTVNDITTAQSLGLAYKTASDVFSFQRLILPMFLIQIGTWFVLAGLLTLLSHLQSTGMSLFQFLKSLGQKKKSTLEPVASTDPVVSASDITAIPIDLDLEKEKEDELAPTKTAYVDEEVLLETKNLQNDTTDEYVMKVLGLKKSYRVPKPRVKGQKSGKKELKVLQNLYLGLKKNECFGFLGPNGAGKSTTIKILTGLESCTSGSAFIAGLPAAPFFTPQIRHMIGLCPQNSVLWDTLSPREHFEVYARIRMRTSILEEEGETEVKKEEKVKVEVEKIIDAFNLHEYENLRVSALSGGNKRKVAMGIAMIGNPKLVFLDEPTTGIDIANRQIIWKAVNELKKTSAIVLTSHSMEEVEALSDRIGIMINGKLKCLGTPQRLKNVYGTGYKIDVKCTTAENARAFGQYFCENLSKYLAENKGLAPPPKLQSDSASTSGGSGSETKVEKEDESGPQVRRIIGSNLVLELPLSHSTAKDKTLSTLEVLQQVFSVVENGKDYGVLECAVSQTTLAQVFVELVKEQSI